MLKWILWTTSRSPTIVKTANGLVQTHEEAAVYDYESPRKPRQQCCRSESFAIKTDILMNGSMVKNHISLKTWLGFPAIRKTSFLLWFQACQVRPLDLHQLQRHLRDRRVIPHHLLQAHLLHLQWVKFRLENERIKLRVTSLQCTCQLRLMKDRGDLMISKPIKSQKTNKKESKSEQSDPLCSEIPEWLQEFREILVDDEIPEHGDTHASSSHEVSLEPTFKRREDLCKHSVYTHFPKDRNCEICKRTKITRAPCRIRIGRVVLRAENFGDLITADHKVLSDNCESRNNHRCAVVIQWLSHSMDPSISVQNKNFTRNPEKLAKVPGTR